MTERGDRTREHLLDVAERLYGERGVASVSMREIRVASGARNTAALQFHFGDRDGLIDALIARHMPRVGEIQQRLYEDTHESRRTRRALVEVLVRPSAEYLTRGESERAWVKIMNDLAGLPDLHLKEMEFVTPEAGVRAGAELYERLQEYVAPELARERLIMLAQLSVHATADYARMIDNTTDTRSYLPPDVFIENLVDMLEAATFAPMSTATAKRLHIR